MTRHHPRLDRSPNAKANQLPIGVSAPHTRAENPDLEMVRRVADDGRSTSQERYPRCYRA
jgi:hypothetical protein